MDAMACMKGQSTVRRFAIIRSVVNEILLEHSKGADRIIADLRGIIQSLPARKQALRILERKAA
jgi:hypothetical protein